MKNNRARVTRGTRVPVRSSLDFINKLMELGYTKKDALNKYRFINIKCETKLRFR